MKSDIQEQLTDYMRSRLIINTHSHHREDENPAGMSMNKLLSQSYVDWCGIPIPERSADRAAYLDRVRYKSYFVWLQRSLQEIYEIRQPLSADNWDEYSDRISSAHLDRDFHISVLEQKCKYKKVILDAYWEPGSDNGLPALFTPTFRVNPFFYAYSRDSQDHNGNNAAILYNLHANELDHYIDAVRLIIESKKSQGCVALKCALAYDRDLNFEAVDKDTARHAYKRALKLQGRNDIRVFQNYLFQAICEIAAELKLPLQCHTGLGLLHDSRAINMIQSIECNPETKFILFHGSFPWTDDITALIHKFPNVYPDLCWLPILSPDKAVQMIHQLIEVGTADKVSWGCDTWTSEESYGALLAFRHVMTRALQEKIEHGYLDMEDAKAIIDRYTSRNASAIYGI